MERNHVPADLSYVGREMTTSQYSVGLGMNQWELDLWGRIRSLNEAALQQFFAVESNVQAVRNSLIQQTVLSYLTLSELDKRIYFAQRSVQNYENQYEFLSAVLRWVQALKWNTCKQKQCSVMVKL